MVQAKGYKIEPGRYIDQHIFDIQHDDARLNYIKIII